MFQKLAEADREPGDLDCNFFGWNGWVRCHFICIHVFVMIRHYPHCAGSLSLEDRAVDFVSLRKGMEVMDNYEI